MLRIRYRQIGILLLTVLVLALSAAVYRYENPPVFVIEEPEEEYDGATMRHILRSLHLEAMLDTFGLESDDYVICTDAEDEQLRAIDTAVYVSLGMQQGYTIHGENTYRPIVLAQRENPEQTILLWQDIHAINHCYFAEATDNGTDYTLKQHRRALGTRFEFKLRQEIEERS